MRFVKHFKCCATFKTGPSGGVARYKAHSHPEPTEMRLGQSTQKCDSVSLLANTTRRGDSQRRLGESARTQLPRSHADPSPDSQVVSGRPPRDGRRSLAARAADRSARQARGTQPNCKRAASWDRQASDFGFLLLDCRFADKRASPRRAAPGPNRGPRPGPPGPSRLRPNRF